MDDFALENPANFGKNGSRQARLVALEKSDPRFAEIEELFKEGWKHPDKKVPYLRTVYKVLSPESMLQPFKEYQTTLSSTPSFWTAFFTKPIEIKESLLFHGTTRACLLGESTRNTLLCDLPECSLCTILRESFDVNKCGRKNKFSRFGRGIYTSSCSSKADDYSHSTSEKANLRVVMLNRVVLGKTCRLHRNAVNLTGPPSGYHSVTGEPGEKLNYEESVVYRNEAIRPAYILVYGDEPEKPRRELRALIRRLFTTPLVHT